MHLLFICMLQYYVTSTISFTQTFQRYVLTASVDRYVECGDEEHPFSGVTNYSRLWRKGGGKRGLECGSPKVILKGGHGVFNMCNDFSVCCAHKQRTDIEE